MLIKPMHENYKRPFRASEGAGGYDLFMPDAGILPSSQEEGSFFGLGFSAIVPEGYVALLLPRSGVGAKKGLSLNNTMGVIDVDYRGEWLACLRNRNFSPITWNAGDSLIQMLLVPVKQTEFIEVGNLDETVRGIGGFGSTSSVSNI